MALTYSLRTAADLYAKLKRDAAALDEEVSSDNAFDFLVTAHHLEEWIRKDPTTRGPIAERLAALKPNSYLTLCSDLANASKHFVQGRKGAIEEVHGDQGFGMGRYGKGSYGVGEESITIHLADGTSLSILDLSNEVMKFYGQVFDDLGPPTEGQCADDSQPS